MAIIFLIWESVMFLFNRVAPKNDIFLPSNSLLYYAKSLLDSLIVKDKLKELSFKNTSNTFSLVMHVAKYFVILINYCCIDPFIVVLVLLLLNNLHLQKNKCFT